MSNIENIAYAGNAELPGTSLKVGETIHAISRMEIPLDPLITAKTADEAVIALKNIKWNVDKDGTTHIEGNYGCGLEGALGLLCGLIKAVPQLIERIERLEHYAKTNGLPKDIERIL